MFSISVLEYAVTWDGTEIYGRYKLVYYEPRTGALSI